MRYSAGNYVTIEAIRTVTLQLHLKQFARVVYSMQLQ